MKRKILNDKISFRLPVPMRNELRRQADITVCHESDLCRRALAMLLDDLSRKTDVQRPRLGN
jgi:hypothetical protein